MNRLHQWVCRSGKWNEFLRDELLPWVLNGGDAGPQVLEIGPGPGLTTELLRGKCARLTAIAIDPVLAASLQRRMKGTNAAVVRGDAASMPFPDATFSGAIALTMLHHVPSPALQDRLLREVHRVLCPGGVFFGSDGLASLPLRLFHIGDTYVPVDPAGFGQRLKSAGFRRVHVETAARRFRFIAVRD